jgi:hypothetical protein
VLSAVGGVGVIIFAIVRFGRTDPSFFVFFVIVALLICGSFIWSAFGRTAERRGDDHT